MQVYFFLVKVCKSIIWKIWKVNIPFFLENKILYYLLQNIFFSLLLYTCISFGNDMILITAATKINYNKYLWLKWLHFSYILKIHCELITKKGSPAIQWSFHCITTFSQSIKNVSLSFYLWWLKKQTTSHLTDYVL